jgi:hypothetical protein
MKGSFYPGGGVEDYYIGATHPDDWVSVTIDVKTTGTYLMTSTWSSGASAADGGIDYKVFINDLTRTTPLIEVKLPTTGDYHLWDADDGPHMVQLTAGVQLLTFQCVIHHLNLDYLQFSLVEADGGIDVGNSNPGYGLATDAGATSGSGASGSAMSGTGSASGSASGVATSGAASTGAGSGNMTTSGAVATSGTVVGSGFSSGGPGGASAGTSMATSGAGSESGASPASGASSPSGSKGVTGGGSHGTGCSLGPTGGNMQGGIAAACLALIGAFGARRRKSRRL